MPKIFAINIAILVLSGCASIDEREVVQTLPDPPRAPAQSSVGATNGQGAGMESRVLKRKVAIARFTNETKYGDGLFTDKNYD